MIQRAWKRKNSITVGSHLCIIFVILAVITLFFRFLFSICFIHGILKTGKQIYVRTGMQRATSAYLCDYLSSYMRSLLTLCRKSGGWLFSIIFVPPQACCAQQVGILADLLDFSGFGLNFSRHEFLITIVQYGLKDQALKGLGGVFRVISCFGIIKPMSVNDENCGKFAEQGQQGLVDQMSKACQ